MRLWLGRWLLTGLRWILRSLCSLWYIGAIASRPLFEGFSRSLIVYLTVLAVFLRGRSRVPRPAKTAVSRQAPPFHINKVMLESITPPSPNINHFLAYLSSSSQRGQRSRCCCRERVMQIFADTIHDISRSEQKSRQSLFIPGTGTCGL